MGRGRRLPEEREGDRAAFPERTGVGWLQGGHAPCAPRTRARPGLLWEGPTVWGGAGRGWGCSQDSHFSILTATFIVA